MDILIIVDVQQASVEQAGNYQLPEVLDRINQLSASVREQNGAVVFVQHDGDKGDEYEPNTPGWQIASALSMESADKVVHKRTNDSFQGTGLEELLNSFGATRVMICGMSTDFCVDNAIRSAVARGFHVVVAADAHTLRDRPHLDAGAIIEHHNWVWENLIAPGSVRVAPSAEILAEY